MTLIPVASASGLWRPRKIFANAIRSYTNSMRRSAVPGAITIHRGGDAAPTGGLVGFAMIRT